MSLVGVSQSDLCKQANPIDAERKLKPGGTRPLPLHQCKSACQSVHYAIRTADSWCICAIESARAAYKRRTGLRRRRRQELGSTPRVSSSSEPRLSDRLEGLLRVRPCACPFSLLHRCRSVFKSQPSPRALTCAYILQQLHKPSTRSTAGRPPTPQALLVFRLLLYVITRNAVCYVVLTCLSTVSALCLLLVRGLLAFCRSIYQRRRHCSSIAMFPTRDPAYGNDHGYADQTQSSSPVLPSSSHARSSSTAYPLAYPTSATATSPTNYAYSPYHSPAFQQPSANQSPIYGQFNVPAQPTRVSYDMAPQRPHVPFQISTAASSSNSSANHSPIDQGYKPYPMDPWSPSQSNNQPVPISESIINQPSTYFPTQYEQSTRPRLTQSRSAGEPGAFHYTTQMTPSSTSYSRPPSRSVSTSSAPAYTPYPTDRTSQRDQLSRGPITTDVTAPYTSHGDPIPRPHICDNCRQAFQRGHDLKRHMSVHSATKEYTCECGKMFSRKDAMKRHTDTKRCAPMERDD